MIFFLYNFTKKGRNKMKLIYGNAKANLILSIFLFCAMMVFLYSCGSGSGGGGDDSSSGTGSVSFSLVMLNQDNARTANDIAQEETDGQIECQTDTYQIASIEVEVVDANDEVLAQGGPWDCEDHQGIISDVEAGAGRIVKGVARDPSGVIIAEGQSDPVTVIAGQTANAGTIELQSAPVADAGPDQTRIVGDTVILDGSGSYDVDGDRLSYSWSFTRLPTDSQAALSDPTAVNPTFDVDKFGTYVAQLIVNDGDMNSAPDSVTIDTENSAPVADAGLDQTASVGDTVILDGSGSYDVDEDLLSYSWSFTGLPPDSQALLSDPTAVNPTFDVDVSGTYEVQLIVNDGAENSDPDRVTIGAQSRPVAVADADPTTPFVGDTVTLDGSGSFDADGDELSYFWSFTSLPTGSQAVLSVPTASDPTFDVDVSGTYVAQLIVNDDIVDSVPATVAIITQNSAPVLAPIGPQSVTEGETLVIEVTASDPDDDPLNFPQPADLPDGASFTDNGDNTATFTWATGYFDSFYSPYTLTFEVFDDQSPALSDSETVTITVNGPYSE
jgi:hypothetical protein